MPTELGEIKSYSVPVANIDDINPNLNIIVLKNKLDEMQRLSCPCVILFHKMSNLKSPEEHLRLLQLYMPWMSENELKQDNQF